jgi:thiamine-phosphate pyrophosphorylase
VEWVVAEAVAGGATLVQLRDKEATTADLVITAGRLLEVLEKPGVPLLINDRLDVAQAVRAAGVHIGQSDMPPLLARSLLGEGAVIGLSADTLDQALEAQELDVDYLGVGPVFATATKSDTEAPWGIEGLRSLRPRSRLPLVAIGGIDARSVGEIMAVGADGVAVVSAICSADDPRRAAAELREAVERGRAGV